MTLIFGWPLHQSDVNSAFLETGQAMRDVNVVGPRESNDRGRTQWLLLTAAYGIVKETSKWQVQSDALLHELYFQSTSLVP